MNGWQQTWVLRAGYGFIVVAVLTSLAGTVLFTWARYTLDEMLEREATQVEETKRRLAGIRIRQEIKDHLISSEKFQADLASQLGSAMKLAQSGFRLTFCMFVAGFLLRRYALQPKTANPGDREASPDSR